MLLSYRIPYKNEIAAPASQKKRPSQPAACGPRFLEMKAIDWGHGGETTVTGTPLAHYTVSPPTPVRTPRPPPPTALRRKAAAAAAAAKSSPRAS
eukprot:SAG25_NODE_1738_length_2423_cov_2.702668_1_plen_94_part_10